MTDGLRRQFLVILPILVGILGCLLFLAPDAVAQSGTGPSVFCHVTDGVFTDCEIGTPGTEEWSDITPTIFPDTGGVIYADQADLVDNSKIADFEAGLGLAADYLSEALHALRSRYDFDRYVSTRVRVLGTEDIRDEKSIHRVAAALLRLLFPHLQVEDSDFTKYSVEPAIRFRQLVRRQLHLMDPEFPNYELTYELLPGATQPPSSAQWNPQTGSSADLMNGG